MVIGVKHEQTLEEERITSRSNKRKGGPWNPSQIVYTEGAGGIVCHAQEYPREQMTDVGQQPPQQIPSRQTMQ